MVTLPDHRLTKKAVIDQYKRVENGRERLYIDIPIQELRIAVGMLNDYAESFRDKRHIFMARHADRVCEKLARVKDYFADVVELDNIRDQLGEVTFSDYTSEVEEPIFAYGSVVNTIKGVHDG